jgi:hypothetical protein
VRGGFWHTNTVEGYFSIMKRGITGTYRFEQNLEDLILLLGRAPNPAACSASVQDCTATARTREYAEWNSLRTQAGPVESPSPT